MSNRFKRLEPYLFALAAVGVGTMARLLLERQPGSTTPYLTFYPAVLLAAYRGGLWPGVFATLCSAAVVALVAATGSPVHPLAFFVFLGIGFYVSWVCHKLLQARDVAAAERLYLQQTLASIGDGVMVTDVTGSVTFLNPAAEKLTGWSSDEATKKSIGDVFQIEDEDTGKPLDDPFYRILRQGVLAPGGQRIALLSRDGTVLPIEERGAPIRDNAGRLIGTVVVFRDVSETRKAARALEESREHLHRTFESITDSFFSVDADWHFVYVNRAAAAWFGFDADDMLGTSIWRQLSYLADTDVETGFRRAVDLRQPEHFEWHSARLGRWIELHAYPTQGGGLSVYFRDITQRKRHEDELRRANEDLQYFSYGISHDLQEPLRMIASYSQLLVRRYRGQLNSDAEDYMGFITEGVERMRALIEALLTYSRAGGMRTTEASATDAEVACRQALASLRSAIEETRATLDVGPLPRVLADPIAMTQIFQNLIGNAIKYRSEAPLSICVTARRRDDHCEFRIEDNGLGLPEGEHERIFNAFHRAHRVNRSGTGLGLATCKRLVELYGGRIWAESAGHGKGSVFCFTFRSAETGVASET